MLRFKYVLLCLALSFGCVDTNERILKTKEQSILLDSFDEFKDDIDAPKCDVQYVKAYDQAAFATRTVLTSRAFRQCVYLKTSNYIACNPTGTTAGIDSDVSSNNRHDAFLLAMKASLNINNISYNCLGQAGYEGDFDDLAKTSTNPYGNYDSEDNFKFSYFYNETRLKIFGDLKDSSDDTNIDDIASGTQKLPTSVHGFVTGGNTYPAGYWYSIPTMPISSIGEVMVHESMHQHAYVHDNSCTGVNTTNRLTHIISSCFQDVYDMSYEAGCGPCPDQEERDISKCMEKGRLRLVKNYNPSYTDITYATRNRTYTHPDSLCEWSYDPNHRHELAKNYAPGSENRRILSSYGNALLTYEPETNLRVDHAYVNTSVVIGRNYPLGESVKIPVPGNYLENEPQQNMLFIDVEGLFDATYGTTNKLTQRGHLNFGDEADVIGRGYGAIPFKLEQGVNQIHDAGRYSLNSDLLGFQLPFVDEIFITSSDESLGGAALLISPDGYDLYKNKYATRIFYPWGTHLVHRAHEMCEFEGPTCNPEEIEFSPRSKFILFGDFNGDGRRDFVMRNDDTNELFFMTKVRDYSEFELLSKISLDGTTSGYVLANIDDQTTFNKTWVGDLNGDGREEIVVKTTEGLSVIGLGAYDATENWTHQAFVMREIPFGQTISNTWTLDENDQIERVGRLQHTDRAGILLTGEQGLTLLSFDNSVNTNLSNEYIDQGYTVGDAMLIPALDRPMPTNAAYHTDMGVLSSINYTHRKHQVMPGTFGDYDGDGLLEFVVGDNTEQVLVGAAGTTSNSNNLSGFVVKDHAQLGCTDNDPLFHGEKICHGGLWGAWLKTPRDAHLMSLKDNLGVGDSMVVFRDSVCGSVEDNAAHPSCPGQRGLF